MVTTSVTRARRRRSAAGVACAAVLVAMTTTTGGSCPVAAAPVRHTQPQPIHLARHVQFEGRRAGHVADLMSGHINGFPPAPAVPAPVTPAVPHPVVPHPVVPAANVRAPRTPAPVIHRPVVRTLITPAAPAAGAATSVIAYAMAQLGKPYRWAGIGPDAFDCSGLTLMAFRSAGIRLPRIAAAQAHVGTYIPPSAGFGALRPGDLVFWATNPGNLATVHHVALYIGGGRVVQAPSTGSVVKISILWTQEYAGAARVLG